MNVIEDRENRARRRARESAGRVNEVSGKGQERENRDRKKGEEVPGKDKRIPDTSFALGERKSGLTWGGGNILASDATRGTRRKFLRR
ncbi:MAG TPA: hypothetical protein ENO05_02365 [Bacteroides sp.]|nr:hypothetical protein [Bacteroides sp.]